MKIKSLLSVLMLLLSGFVMAVDYTDTAKITKIEEIYKTVQTQKPYQYCREVAVHPDYRGDGSATNELIGGILGGAIGNQFGKGSGKDVATVAGALLGASLANDDEVAALKRNNPKGVRTQEVCETRYDYKSQERFSHYLVTYNYQGVDHTYQSSYKPKGDTINVKVMVRVKPENSYRR